MVVKGLGKGGRAWAKHNKSVNKNVARTKREMDKEFRKLYGGSVKKW